MELVREYLHLLPAKPNNLRGSQKDIASSLEAESSVLCSTNKSVVWVATSERERKEREGVDHADSTRLHTVSTDNKRESKLKRPTSVWRAM